MFCTRPIAVFNIEWNVLSKLNAPCSSAVQITRSQDGFFYNFVQMFAHTKYDEYFFFVKADLSQYLL